VVICFSSVRFVENQEQINEMRNLSIKDIGHISLKTNRENAVDNCRSIILASKLH